MQLARNAGYGEWNSWSNNPARAMPVRFGEDDVALQLRARKPIGRACVAKTLRSIPMTAPSARSKTMRSTSRAAATASGSTSPRTRRPRAALPAASDGRLVAPMNGRVVAVNAKAGDTAEAGRALVVLEAMKMEHTLSVPDGGARQSRARRGRRAGRARPASG